jgi:hypothetical protein
MKPILRSSLSILMMAAATTAGVAHADPNNPTDNDKAAARPFAIEGLRLAQAGNCRDAVDKLERGEALVHAPTTAVPLAQCDIQLGKIITGTEILNRVINESLPPGAPASWAESKQQARGMLDAAQPRIGKLRIHVDVAPGFTPNPEVTVDGQLVPLVLLDNDRPTDPGPHHIVARQAGVGSAETDVTLTDGQVRPVSLRLGPAGVAAVAPAPGAVDPYGPNHAVGQPAVAAPPDPYASAGAAPGAASAPVGASGDAGFPVALEFGARAAFGVPFGSRFGGNGNDLNQTVSNMIVPLWLEFGARLDNHWYFGGYFSYAVTSLANQVTNASGCNNPNTSCSSNDIRLGANAEYHVLPDGRFDPWFGLGFGYEWLSLSESQGSLSFSGGDSGFEFVDFQGGLDFRLANGAFGIGPFVSLALGEYTSASIANQNGDGGSTSSSITNQAFHEWLLFGVHADYDLKLP